MQRAYLGSFCLNLEWILDSSKPIGQFSLSCGNQKLGIDLSTASGGANVRCDGVVGSNLGHTEGCVSKLLYKSTK